MSKQSPLRQLVDIIKHKTGLNQEQIAAKAGYRRTYLSQALSMPDPPEKLLTKLKLTFKDVLKNEHIGENVARGTLGSQILNEPDTGTENYLQKRRALKNSVMPYMVPLVPVKAQAGYAANFNNTDFLNQLELYPILPGIDPRGAVWRFFEVGGDSMEPILFETDLVLVSMVPHADWQDVKNGDVYVVITADEYVYIKQVFKKDKENWILRSVNKRKGERLQAVSDIKEVWKYRRHVTNKIQWPKDK